MKPRGIVPILKPAPPSGTVPFIGALPAQQAQRLPNLTYHGGSLLVRAQVFTIFWGAAWENPKQNALAVRLNQFFDFILDSAYMDVLAEYTVPGKTIGRGSRIGTQTITLSEPGGISKLIGDNAIQDAIHHWISTKVIPAPGENTLYFVFLPPGVTSGIAEERSCKEYCGYHGETDGVVYAVVPYVTCSGCGSGGSQLDILACVSSHELAEAITDPRNDGWFDDAIENGEIGDICNLRCKRLGEFSVQLEWSRISNKCVLVPHEDHFYTTSLTERDNATAHLNYRSEGITCFVLPQQAGGAAALHRLFSPTVGDHLYTMSDLERNQVITAGGYVPEGEACFAFTGRNRPQGSVPLHRLFNADSGDHLYTISDAERDQVTASGGYASEGEACFAFASDTSGTMALYRSFNPKSGDHFYTTSLAERDDSVGLHGYAPEDISCFVFPAPAPGAVALHRLFNPKTNDHFYTISDAERTDAVDKLGYRDEGNACFVFAGQSPGTLPLHRLLSPNTGDHFYTLSDQEQDDAASQRGYVNEGEACYVFASSPAGLVAFYRLTAPI